MPTTDEIRATHAVCPVCKTRCKNKRGLQQHQRTNDKCLQLQFCLRKRDEGYGLAHTSCGMYALASTFVDCAPYKDKSAWVPTWLMQAIRMYAVENYDITTPVERRTGKRWGMSPRLQEKVADALASPQIQAAYSYQYTLEGLTHKQEALYMELKWVLTSPIWKFNPECLRRKARPQTGYKGSGL